ncbi:amidophosphoribosyltransferase [Cadophora gregata]|uniref:amidophosphoribosyltransferase n=1 Tax=Cadophora gregata TaxID=51156 RepID=UPI0026DB7BD5|nr:amidophosphoribosyltransferase [Cadophora gregata]KAK0112810.1 amidophosphoribosyltransferase [Cadophora gregata]KAK0124938.1 amidophosphoribosyltransferase [Cadophora gregata f. sp. sojae]
MCGVLALILGNLDSKDAAIELHNALYALHHRGQDACGIATSHKSGRMYSCKGKGFASKVFRDSALLPELPGFMGLGHLRYPTAGTSSNAASQPFYVSSPYGLLFSHNGNLLNTDKLKEYLDRKAHPPINTDSDSEIMLQVLASQLLQRDKRRVDADDIFTGLEKMFKMTVGGFAFCGMVAGFAIFGARDPNGIRPLVMGSRNNRDGKGVDYMLASESIALEQLGFTDVQDIRPGEAVIIPKGGKPIFRQVHPELSYTPDIFEYCYFSREDSTIDGISVYQSRQNMGYKLSHTIWEILGQSSVDDIDVVIPIPDSGVVSALAVAESLQKPYRHAFSRNRYTFRTFIMPSQEKRRKSVQSKLNPQRREFEGKTVLLIDDTIARGTTSLRVCNMARDAGAKKVYFAYTAPPVTHPHIYGIDLATSSEMVAHNRDRKAIAASINADEVVFLSLEDLEAACAELSPRPNQRFEVGVFCGRYVTPVSDGYLKKFESTRGKSRIEDASVGGFATVGDSMTTPPPVGGRSDVSLHNMVADQ